jgi:deoxyribonuclease-4
MSYFFGAHLSIAGGYHMALDRLSAIGGNALQIFSASPRGWNTASITDEHKKIFLEKKKRLNIGPVFFHASYLVNFADSDRIADNSKKSLIAEMTVAAELGIVGSIVHLGSFKKTPPSLFDVASESGYKTLIENIRFVLDHTPKSVYFIIENAGNNKIGKSIAEIAAIIRDVQSDRIRVCLDTCHLYSAGYDLGTPDKLNSFLREFDSVIGLDKVIVIHANDSRDPFGSGRDRHENIGQGTLSVRPFELLVRDSRTKHLPFIIETPGFDGNGPDKKNLDILKSLVKV